MMRYAVFWQEGVNDVGANEILPQVRHTGIE